MKRGIRYKIRTVPFFVLFLCTLMFLFVLSLSFITGCEKPQVTREEFSEIDVSQEPMQVPDTSHEPLTIKMSDGEFTITPIAAYKISAVVVSKKSYNDGWRADIAPIDLALVWGKLAEPEYDAYITYSQHDRWYFYEYKEKSPLAPSYIITHSGNNHIIPADENIFIAIKTIGKKQKVLLEGFLVNIRGSYKGKQLWWNSSLTRTDSGDGSCELFYVQRVKIGNNVYE